MESNQIFKCNLLDTWPKSSSVNSINLVKKSATIQKIYNFFQGIVFYWRTRYIVGISLIIFCLTINMSVTI